jgi:hypothetical protein
MNNDNMVGLGVRIRYPQGETPLSGTIRFKAKMRPKAKDRRLITTAGEVLPHGTMIELIAGGAGNKPDVLLWNRVKATVV